MNAASPTSVQASETDLPRVGLLGLNAWLVVVVAPGLHAGLGSAMEVLAAGVPALVLALSLRILARDARAARWPLLAAVPASIGAVIASRPDHDAYGGVGLAVSALSLLAFAVASAHAVGRDRARRPALSVPLAGKEPVAEPGARRILRRALLAVAAAGSFALAVLAPSLSDRRERVGTWGEAADDAVVLASVVATVCAAGVLAALVGPALRAARPPRDERARSRRRLGVAMLVAAAAGVGWLLLHRTEPP